MSDICVSNSSFLEVNNPCDEIYNKGVNNGSIFIDVTGLLKNIVFWKTSKFFW